MEFVDFFKSITDFSWLKGDPPKKILAMFPLSKNCSVEKKNVKKLVLVQ